MYSTSRPRSIFETENPVATSCLWSMGTFTSSLTSIKSSCMWSFNSLRILLNETFLELSGWPVHLQLVHLSNADFSAWASFGFKIPARLQSSDMSSTDWWVYPWSLRASIRAYWAYLATFECEEKSEDEYDDLIESKYVEKSDLTEGTTWRRVRRAVLVYIGIIKRWSEIPSNGWITNKFSELMMSELLRTEFPKSRNPSPFVM